MAAEKLSKFSTGSSQQGDSGGGGDFLYDSKRLTQLTKWPQIELKLKQLHLIARPLRRGDFDLGYLELLKQLTHVGNVSREDFVRQFDKMSMINKVNEHYFVIVLEDTQTNRIIACSTLALELKFIHECSSRCRLEDVAVLDSYRGKGVGQIIVELIVELAREGTGCYKLTLDCNDQLKKFYQLNGFTYGCNMMSIRFQDGH